VQSPQSQIQTPVAVTNRHVSKPLAQTQWRMLNPKNNHFNHKQTHAMWWLTPLLTPCSVTVLRVTSASKQRDLPYGYIAARIGRTTDLVRGKRNLLKNPTSRDRQCRT
jgi:hypothetical protein